MGDPELRGNWVLGSENQGPGVEALRPGEELGSEGERLESEEIWGWRLEI